MVDKKIISVNETIKMIRLESNSKPINILSSLKGNGIRNGDNIRIHHNLKGGTKKKKKMTKKEMMRKKKNKRKRMLKKKRKKCPNGIKCREGKWCT